MKIYQLVSYVNAYNKRMKKWETLRTVSNIYVGAEGLKTAYRDFETEKKSIPSINYCWQLEQV